MPRGGARPGAGRPRKDPIPDGATIEKPNRPKQDRKSNGQFARGQSGNLRGRPVMPEALRQLAQECGEEALLVVRDLMRDKATPGKLRLAAATALLDRGYGKPKQPVDVDVDADIQVVLDV